MDSTLKGGGLQQRSSASGAGQSKRRPHGLPEVMVPFAERLFAWFPEVLVSLGQANLEELFEVPPRPGAELRLEECGEHKLVLVKLRRRAKRLTTHLGNSGTGAVDLEKARAGAAGSHAGQGRTVNAPWGTQPLAEPPVKGVPAGPAAAEAAAARPVVPGPVVAVGSASIGPSGSAQHIFSQDSSSRPASGQVAKVAGAQQAAQAPRQGEETPRTRRALSNVSDSRRPPPNASYEEPASPKTVLYEVDPWANVEIPDMPEGRGVVVKASAALLPGLPATSNQTTAEVEVQKQPDGLEGAAERESEQQSHEGGSLPGKTDSGFKSLDLADLVGTANEQTEVETALDDPSAPAEDATVTAEVVMVSAEAAAQMERPKPSLRDGFQSQQAKPSFRDPLQAMQDQRPAVILLPKVKQESEQTQTPRSEGAKQEGESVEGSVQTPKKISGSTSLRERRKLQLASPVAPDVSAAARDSLPEDMSPMAVLSPKRLLQNKPLLPGAFANRRTLIFFDWDDTLCPTSWIRNLLQRHMSERKEWFSEKDLDMDWRYQIPAWFGQPLPDMTHVSDPISRLQKAVIAVINKAQTLGVVCIVTNAVGGWVEKTTRKWLPMLTQYILGHGTRPRIQVLYGQQEYDRPPVESKAYTLGWVDGLGELMWWKKAAMCTAFDRLDGLYRVTADSSHTPSVIPLNAGSSSDSTEKPPLPQVPWQADSSAKSLWNVLSIGDSDAEMQSVWVAALAHGAKLPAAARGKSRPLSVSPRPRGRAAAARPWIKTLKFKGEPTADELVTQLEALAEALTKIVAEGRDLDLTAEDLPALSPAAAARSSAEARIEARLQRQLRTQTV